MVYSQCAVVGAEYNYASAEELAEIKNKIDELCRKYGAQQLSAVPVDDKTVQCAFSGKNISAMDKFYKDLQQIQQVREITKYTVNSLQKFSTLKSEKVVRLEETILKVMASQGANL